MKSFPPSQTVMLSESIIHSSSNLSTAKRADLPSPASTDSMNVFMFGGRYNKKTMLIPNIFFTSGYKCALILSQNMINQTPSPHTSFLCATNFRSISLITTMSTHTLFYQDTPTYLSSLSIGRRQATVEQ